MDRVMISQSGLEATHKLETIWGPVSSSLCVSCEPLRCCGPSTCSSSVWWDGYQRTSLDKQRERSVRVPGWYQMPCNNSCSESLCETHRSSLSWLSRSHLDPWSSQNRSLWFFQSVCLWPPADTVMIRAGRCDPNYLSPYTFENLW